MYSPHGLAALPRTGDVEHHTLRSARGEKPGREVFAREVEQRSWEEPVQIGESSWSETKRRFRESYEQMIALVQHAEKLERPRYHLLHESYHFGQIMYVRALQGLPPIE